VRANATEPALSKGPQPRPTADDPGDAVTALLRAARNAPEAGVVTVDRAGRAARLCYPDLEDRARRILGGLRAAGSGAGDPVILYGLGPADFFPAFWACVLGGMHPAPIAGDTAGPALERLRQTSRRLEEPLVLTDRAGARALDEHGGPTGSVRTLQDLAAHEPAADHHRPAPDDVALLMLSSGSTGAPKAAELTHRALAEFAYGARRTLDLRADGVSLNWLPVDHSGAFLLHHLLQVFVGCTNVHAPTDWVLGEPLRWLDLMAEHRISHSWAPMFGYRLVTRALADRPHGDWDLRAVRALVCGGEQIAPDAVGEFLAATARYGVPGDVFRPAWGMAETVTGITYGRLGADGAGTLLVRRDSMAGDLVLASGPADSPELLALVPVGPPEPGAELRITDESGAVLPQRRIGRLQVRSARVSSGYRNDPAASARARTADGWLETGDLGFLTGGELVVTGRAKDMLIVNGQNHSCQEIEQAAAAVQGVTPGRVAACGVPNPATGSEDLVVLYATDGSGAAPEPIARAVRATLFLRLRLTPTRVLAVPPERFPLTTSGKIRRGELRAALLAGEFDPAEPVDARGAGDPVARAAGLEPRVQAAVAEVLGRPADPHLAFYELGLTSVTLARVAAVLERSLGTPVAPADLFAHPTAAGLAAHLAAAGATRQDPGADRGADPVPAIVPGIAPAIGLPQADRRIAVVGMAARFPGAADLDAFWANLRAGLDSTREFTSEELERAGVPRDRSGDPAFRSAAGVLSGLDEADPGFFGISTSEAELTDPAHALFLETCYRALEHGGYAGPEAGGRIGVYAGSGMQLYGHQDHPAARPADPQAALSAAFGSHGDFLAAKVAYRLGLTGPAVNVQTACSTSLVAVHLAVQALLTGDADLALAGAAAVRTPQEAGYLHFPGSILSEQGRCRPFDAAADGTVGGNGVAAVLLKRLDRALADGDTVHAVILGSAVNNDGRGKAGFAAPSVAGQSEVVRQALRRAAVEPDTVSYLEAHGTGTPVGDPIELRALAEVFGPGRPVGTPRIAVGSVKGNVGHLDTCAGMAGLLKTVLMLKHGALVPTANLDRPNPALGLAESPFYLPDTERPWPAGHRPRRAGVSALGVGGTNAHVVLEEPATPRPQPQTVREVVLPLSAAGPEALEHLGTELADCLAADPALRPADVAATLALGRPRLPQRRAVTGRTGAELAAALRSGAGGRRAGEPPVVAFVFAGQGGSRAGMARELYADLPAARRVLQECEDWYRQDTGRSLLDLLLSEVPDPAAAWPTDTAQPALFAVQAAQFAVWRALGVEPALVLGHSVGEYAALYAAGALDLRDGLRCTARRGELMHDATEPGGMLAVPLDRAETERIAAEEGLELAAANAPDRHVLAGPAGCIDRVASRLAREGRPGRRLAVDRAFHTALMDPVLDRLAAHLSALDLRPLTTPLVTAADAALLGAGTRPGHDYLCRQARLPVEFQAALQTAERAGVTHLVELGPGRALAGAGRRVLPHCGWSTGVLPAVAELHEAGAEIDWRPLVADGRRIPLPGHPLRRRTGAAAPATPAAPPAPERSAAESAAAAGQSPGPLGRVSELIGSRLSVGAAGLDPDRTLLDQGADSLTLMALARDFQQEFDVRIPLGELFAGTDTARLVASRITAHAGTTDAAPRPCQPSPVSAASPSSPEPADLPVSLPVPVPASPPAPAAEPAAPAHHPTGTCDFSLYFFGDYPDGAAQDKYRLITDAARHADRHGYHALWLPERHFHSFGALFPNPSVLAAALATQTDSVRLHAGSVVLPLHQPIRVAEEWSVVDNLSRGRAGLCFASGWHANDFVLAPENFGTHRELMYQQLETVRRLWRGEEIHAVNGAGEEVGVRLQPRPVQAEPPMFAAVVGNPESYRQAARAGLGVVTNLMAQTVGQLAENIALYRRTRAEHGLDPREGRVVVLVHTYVGGDLERTRAEAFRPFCAYLRSSLSLFDQVTNSLGLEIDLADTPDDDVDFLLGQAYLRYCESRALIGTPDSCAPVVAELVAAGADELACFVDFGVAEQQVLDALPLLDTLRDQCRSAHPEPREPSRPQELSPAQRRIWFLEQLHPGRTTYHEHKAIRLTGPLDPVALRGALRQVIARHPALRTVIGEEHGDPRLLVRQDLEVACPLLDRSGAAEAAVIEAAVIEELVEGPGREPFDLTGGPLVRAVLVRLGAEHSLLFLTVHHIVFDSQSTQILIRELAACYRAWPQAPVGLPPVLTHTPAAVSAEPEQHDASLRFWRERLGGAPEPALPTDRPRPADGAVQGAWLTVEFDAGLAAGLGGFAREQRATVFSTLLGAIAVALSRLGGRHDLVVGTGLSHRPPGAEEAVGMFVDTVPLRLDLSGDPGFGALVHRLAGTALEAYEHRQVPFDELVAALNPDRELGRNPFFQVAVEFETASEVPFAPPLEATSLDVPSRRAPVDVTVYLTHHRAGVRCAVEYDAALFDESTVRRLLDYTELVLRQALPSPSTRLSELAELTEADRLLLAGWQGTPARPLRAPGTLHHLVEQRAAADPGAVALVHGGREVTYGGLDRWAHLLAGRLIDLGVGRGDLVAVRLPRGPELIAALLAVLKSGAGYLPLDPALPAARQEFLLADSAPAVLLTDRQPSEEPRDTGPATGPVVLTVREPAEPDGSPLPRLLPARGPAGPDDLAYCIYTSGSTGRPKAVAVPHRGPVNLVRWDLAQHPPQDTLQWASPGFDGSVMEIFTTLAAGARLVLIDDDVRYDPAAVAAAIRRHRVERVCMPFTPLKYLLDSRPELPSLRTLISAGEATGSSTGLRAFLAGHPRCTLVNLYGPTEGSVCATGHAVDPADLAPPIGRPIDGVELRLVGRDGRAVPVGAVGEIELAGICVADGYRGRPSETAAAFPPDPDRPGRRRYRTGDLARWRADGSLQYHGRADDQVKIRGHRVEPGEVQRQLASLDGVLDAAVVAAPDADGEQQLVGYLVLADPATQDQVVRLAADRLPGYLLPQRWAVLAQLPVNANGKLDRALLPAPQPRPAADRPAGPVEEAVHALWCEVLGLAEAGVTDSFFELGGHSLTAVRLLNAVRDRLGLHLPLAGFFREPTIRDLARSATPTSAAASAAPTPASPTPNAGACPGAPGQRAGAHALGGTPESAPTTSAQRRMWRRHQEHGAPAVHNMCVRVDLAGRLDPAALQAAFETTVARHAALRTRIVDHAGEVRQEVLPPFTVSLPVERVAGGEAGLRRWCEELAGEPFALDRAPLFRVRLARTAPERWTLFLALHHIIGDGWSLRVLWQDVSDCYSAQVNGEPCPGGEPAAQFPDHARQEQAAVGRPARRDLERFWRAELADAPLTPRLPYDRPRPRQLSGRGALHRFALTADLTERLRKTAAATGSTLTVVLAAVGARWLCRLSGEPETVLAVSSAKRPRPEHAGLIGYLGEAVPVRIAAGREQDFAELVRHTGERLYASLEHEGLPLTEAYALADPRAADLRTPPVMFTVITNEAAEPQLTGLTARLSPVPVPGAARTDLYLVFVPGEDDLEVAIEYSTDLLDPATVTAWADLLVEQLAAATTDPAPTGPG